jgi:hypothetical protein
VSARSAGLIQCVLLAFLLVLYFGASPASAARVAMYFAGGQVLAHGLVWWIAERRR